MESVGNVAVVKCISEGVSRLWWVGSFKEGSVLSGGGVEPVNLGVQMTEVSSGQWAELLPGDLGQTMDVAERPYSSTGRQLPYSSKRECPGR